AGNLLRELRTAIFVADTKKRSSSRNRLELHFDRVLQVRSPGVIWNAWQLAEFTPEFVGYLEQIGSAEDHLTNDRQPHINITDEVFHNVRRDISRFDEDKCFGDVNVRQKPRDDDAGSGHQNRNDDHPPFAPY